MNVSKLVSLVAFSATVGTALFSASAQSLLEGSSMGDGIRQSAPAVVLPSDSPARSSGEVEPALLRGSIGQIVQGNGVCRIHDGTSQTAFRYRNGLPHEMKRVFTDLREETASWTWDEERVLLERFSWAIRVKNARGEWSSEQWFVENTTWDNFSRPLMRDVSNSSGRNDRTICTWQNLRQGTCVLGGVEHAEVRLSPRGEVVSTAWKQAGSGEARGSWTSEVNGTTTVIKRTRRTTSFEDQYVSNERGQLTRVTRKEPSLRGERVVQWSLSRDARGNVTRIDRACVSGPCEGARSQRYDITYDGNMFNSLCGTWWDDGIEPGLRGLHVPWNASH